ncbi:mannose-specific lectin-like [Dioscorea cayenensis subsp. rotundata]|uniref:Mannose-specific lectin-like n=1 Tax=Dioscorea cayennensis subsp. rotundata TaxID=55577 RepID=A0AB40BJ11_DIOCR|nr:mannose-specific lectin-like [Dioscorea cayenensis subsp. rotundata]
MATQTSIKTTAMAMTLLLTMAGITPSLAEDTLFSGENLNSGEFWRTGPYRFIMQGDCNLVLYVNKTKPLWNSRTNGRGTACRVTLQNNGNLVIFSGSDVIWTSDSSRGPNNYRLVMQSDGNVVIYGAALWATNTVQSKKKLL